MGDWVGTGGWATGVGGRWGAWAPPGARAPPGHCREAEMLILRRVFKDPVSCSVVLLCVFEGSVSKTTYVAIAAYHFFTTAPCIKNEMSLLPCVCEGHF